MRSTLLRLERERQDGADLGLELLQRTYDELAETVLALAADRGYLGRDPLGAVSQLSGPDASGVQFARLIHELWRSFFAGFRPDEAQFEAARFKTAAAHIEDELQRLTPGEDPSPGLALQMLETLIALWDERQEALSQRLDTLIGELGAHQQQLGSSQLQSAYQEDELGQAVTLVRTVLGELGEAVPDDARLSGLLATLVKRWRDELQTRKRDHAVLVDQGRAFLEALAAVASGKAADEDLLGKGQRAVTAAIGDLVSANREQAKVNRSLEAQLATAIAEREQLALELQARDELVARYEFSEYSQENEDRRLELYRQIQAAQERGEDHRELLAEVRELERVFVLPEADISQAVTLLDRVLDSLAKSLGGLRKVMPLGEDPKRYRPRLLGSSPYKLKTLPGVMRAARDASRDALAFIGRARWAMGVQTLEGEFRKLRKIFTEMVRLVGDVRDQLGGPPPASCSMNLGTDDGLSSLPAVLATDLKALLKVRGVARHTAELASLLEECVSMFHAALERGRGEAISRPQGPSRETGAKAVARLAEELLDLAGLMEAVFAEAKARGWRLEKEEAGLLEQDQLLQMVVRDIDGLCEVLAVLRGAPATEFAKIPSGRSATARRNDLDRLLKAAKDRVTWLEDVARYRIEASV